jgi:hypothetical protein
LNDTEAHSPALGVPTAAPSPAADQPTAQTALGSARRSGLAPKGVAALVAFVSVLMPISWSGLWAPYELEIADFSRRIAVALHGAESLSVPGVDNTVPILSELGKGQLPFSSVAVGFQLFGLFDWAGRLPLALWAAAGIAATFLLVSRLADRVAAAYAAVALATMPLYYLQARTMLGDGVTLAAVALAASGACLSVFRRPERRASRVGWALLSLVGLCAGFGARGVLLGVAVPMLGVGLAWVLWRLGGYSAPSRGNDVAGAITLGVGLVALAAGVWVLLGGSPDLYLEVLGAKIDLASKLPTHDAMLHQLGFGLFPWSVVAPLAIALPLSRDGANVEQAALRVCLVSVIVVALAVQGLCAPFIGVLPFVGTFAVAAVIGVLFREAESPEVRTRLLALTAAALSIVFLSDLRNTPGQSLLAFALPDAAFPESFTAQAKNWMKYGSLACLVVLSLALGDLPEDKRLLGPVGSASQRWLGRVRTASGGKLRVAIAGLLLVLGVLALLARLSARFPLPLPAALAQRASLLSMAFVAVSALVLAPPLGLLARDVLGAFFRWLPFPRARLALLSLAGFGLALSLGYYPALAAHLSPRNVYESFRERAKPGEPLAVLGQAARVAPYYAGTAVFTPKSARDGLDFLLEAPGERRWLLFGAKDLGTLNQLYRQKSTPPQNVPILDAMSSEVMLASNLLLPGEANENPLSGWISTEAPAPAHPLDIDLNGQLRCLGWAITERDGTPVEEARTGQPYDFRIYYEVVAPVTGTWKTFIHIDGNRRRFNGDHDTLAGKYPFRLWQKGDFMTDVYAFELEPQFAGSTYDVYFGLFSGDKRMSVKRGKHTEDRIAAGRLVVP